MDPTRTAQLLLLSAVAVGGCHSSRYDRESWSYDPQKSRTRAILDAQYAKGAAQDASLSKYHFDGMALNGLGRDKLDWILAGGRGGPIVVHLDLVGTGPQEAEPMLQAVRDYLDASGVAVSEETVVLGPSPRTAGSAVATAGRQRLQQRQPSGGGSATGAIAGQDASGFDGQ